jgi:hypothetical protein
MDDLECLFVSRSRGNYSRRLIEESRSGSPGCGGSTIPVTIGHERGKTEEASRMSSRKARYVSEARSGSLLDSFGRARSQTPGEDLEAVLIALCFFFFDGPRSASASLQTPHTHTHTHTSALAQLNAERSTSSAVYRSRLRDARSRWILLFAR